MHGIARAPADRPTAKSCLGDGSASVTFAQSPAVPVRGVVEHPERDLALLELDVPQTAITPVAIADSAPVAGESLTLAGWGRTAGEWVPATPKSGTATVGAVDSATVALGGGVGLCRGDAGGPALRTSGGVVELVGVHHSGNQAGCLGESGSAAPEATDTRVDDVVSWITANLPAFRSGFEETGTRSNFKNVVASGTGNGGSANVSGVCGSCAGPEMFAGVDSRAHGGTGIGVYSGEDTSATRSFAYLKAFGLGNVRLRPESVLSYWVYPQSKANSFDFADGQNSTCVAVDVVYTDGLNLRDSTVTDQRGHRVHPAQQCGTMPLDTWTQVVVPIGSVAAGKTIANINFGYDQPANTGGYRGFVDDISISDVVRTDPFSTGLETGQAATTWRNTVSSTSPGGGVRNVVGVCGSCAGPETFTGVDGRAHSGTGIILYSGEDTNATSSYAYLGAFALSEVYVTPTTRLSYWIYPQSKDNSIGFADADYSTCVAMDAILRDNVAGTSKSLRSTGVIDQRGNRLHPSSQCGKLTLDAWNYVSVPLGAVANGQQIVQLDLGYDQAANTGGYRGMVDDVRITE